MDSDLTMQGCKNKLSYNLRKEEESRISERHRNILYLISDYLGRNGYMNVSDVLAREARLSREYEVCDNMDLGVIVAEYEDYYKMKFQKYPTLCKKLSGREMRARKRTNANKVRRARSESAKERNLLRKPINYMEDPINLAMSVVPIPTNDYEGASSQELNNEPMEQPTQFKISECIRKLYSNNPEALRIAENISSEIILKNLNVRWNDIVGLEECKNAVKEAVVYPIKYPIFFNGPFTPWKAILLYGPPGTGKTMIAKAAATECHCTFFNITASLLVSKWRGDSEKYIRILFELAYSHSPTIIFIDEIDWITTNNDSMMSEPAKRFRSELLSRMDGLMSRENSNVLLLAATNTPWCIDPALLRRLEKQIYVPLPDAPARHGILKLYLSSEILENEDIIKHIVKYTEKFSCSDLKLFCKQAWLLEINPIWRKLERNETTVTTLKYKLSNYEVLAKLLNEMSPTVTDIEKYVTWRK